MGRILIRNVPPKSQSNLARGPPPTEQMLRFDPTALWLRTFLAEEIIEEKHRVSIRQPQILVALLRRLAIQPGAVHARQFTLPRILRSEYSRSTSARSSSVEQTNFFLSQSISTFIRTAVSMPPGCPGSTGLIEATSNFGSLSVDCCQSRFNKGINCNSDGSSLDMGHANRIVPQLQDTDWWRGWERRW